MPEASEMYRPNLEKYSFLKLPEMRAYFLEEMLLVLGLVQSSTKALVVGCGLGREVQWLGQACFHVTAMDYNYAMLDGAAERLEAFPNVDFIQWDILEPKVCSQYDLVFAGYNLPGASDVAPCDRQKLVQNILAHVVPGGKAVISFWRPCTEEWLRHYYSVMGAEVQAVDGNTIVTTMGTFTRFPFEEIEEFGRSSAATSFKLVAAGPLFTELVLTR